MTNPNTDEGPCDDKGAAVETMLTAAMIAAVQYRNQHGVDALAMIEPTKGVRVAPVFEIMRSLATEDDKCWLNAKASELHEKIMSAPDELWFATKRNNNIDIWNVPLITCMSAWDHHTDA